MQPSNSMAAMMAQIVQAKSKGRASNLSDKFRKNPEEKNEPAHKGKKGPLKKSELNEEKGEY